ncbi:MAG TPA: 6-phosphogluconolactonase [Gemmatimonadaceae bacterium]|jgi:6-phosphogluconolactonase
MSARPLATLEHRLADGREVRVYETPADLAAAGAGMVADALRDAVAARGRAALCLAGGSTPRALYVALATARQVEACWPRTSAIFGDERCVPPDDPASNYRMARESLLARVPIPPPRVHRVRGELPPGVAADAYERTLRTAFGGAQGPNPLAASALRTPLVDVTLLGVGADGHTASLFPGSPALHERTRWAVAVEAPESAAGARERVTLTLPLLAAAPLVVVLAAGADKGPAVRAALEATDGDAPPAGRVRALGGAGRTCWLLDAAAAEGTMPLLRDGAERGTVRPTA